MYEDMIEIDRDARESLQQRIRRRIAIGIVDRRYPPRRPLPSIRRLWAEPGVGVNTVALAYEGLEQEGFVVSRGRSGFFVNRDAPADRGHAPAARVGNEGAAGPERRCRVFRAGRARVG